ncbi:DUF1304 family protein [Alloscardovia sp. HMSC034E08]|uniref:DUF1304 family protein n=1 Tax=Alloscardovia sp. HMSC034E08 TaxID=1739413 RepID=UPI000A61B54F|nr:DUF1304 family protein [Alloscardovia sp. HMSC034E08]
MNTLLIIGLIFAALAGLLHVLIAYLEMFAWEGPLARKTFGGTAEEARPLLSSHTIRVCITVS